MSFYQQLDKSLIDCDPGDNKFLPLTTLEQKVTRKNIRAQLSRSTQLLNWSLPEKVFLHAKKVFAILVLVGEQHAIKGLLREGLLDEHLPLSPHGDGSSRILASQNGQLFMSFSTWKNEPNVGAFLEKQWQVQAPVLNKPGQHINLHKKCPLPLTKCLKAIDGTFPVYEGKVHEAHQSGHEDDGKELSIAMKEFKTEKIFKQEQGNLTRIQDLKHKHLVKLIATCKRDTFYYVLFPWANGGNLRQFWGNQDSKREGKLMLWSLRQMVGLADALRALHGTNCRHGDLKPENILHFKKDDQSGESDEGILVIADVGISKFHRDATNLRNTPTNTTATTRSYEAPEAYSNDNNPRSRKYDTWSIGCVFLEFTVWLLYGHKAVESFSDSRKSTEPNITHGSFYTRKAKGNFPVHPKVSEAVSILRDDPRCRGGTALGDLVEFIAEKLLVGVDHRAEATVLSDELEGIALEVERNPPYFLNLVDLTPEIPHFFKGQEPGQNSAVNNSNT
ncbi:kinase-like domain-containing protein [Ilyonectria sp. MPI-CAGE-AT-0026]|nr:kinase-like domain-containing protein [Ilyonectria sp. MPI-CAGE-AT-0026]